MNINLPSQSPREFLRSFLRIISGLSTPDNYLTPMEERVLIEFILLPTKYRYYRFSPPGKRQVLKSLNLPKFNAPRLNAVIYILLKKKYLYRDEDNTLYLQPFLEKTFQQFISSPTLSITLNFETKLDQGGDTTHSLPSEPAALPSGESHPAPV